MASIKKDGQGLKPAEIAERAAELINRQNTMTLATSCGKSAWAAPVYYVYHSGLFYFFSERGVV